MSALTFGLLGLAAVASWALTGAARRYALGRGMLDVPNQRSSHEVPTPRGGGIAIVAVTLTGLAIGWATGLLAGRVALALIGGGLALALVGWADDRQGLSRRLRLAVHLAAAAGAVLAVGGFRTLALGPVTVELGIAGFPLAVVFIAWLTNLYNFMDGIDGIAAGEAVTAGVFGGALLLFAGAPDLAAVAFLLVAAAGGFLAWNWSPARIFMGDVGSGFLGFVFATLALASEAAGAVPLLAWVVLLGVFIFDATATLVRRALRGERWYQEHRSHAYQRAVQSGLSHAQVTTGVLVANALLAVAAAVAVGRPAAAPAAAAGAIVLLAALYLSVEHRRPMRPRPVSLRQE